MQGEAADEDNGRALGMDVVSAPDAPPRRDPHIGTSRRRTSTTTTTTPVTWQRESGAVSVPVPGSGHATGSGSGSGSLAGYGQGSSSQYSGMSRRMAPSTGDTSDGTRHTGSTYRSIMRRLISRSSASSPGGGSVVGQIDLDGEADSESKLRGKGLVL